MFLGACVVFLANSQFITWSATFFAPPLGRLNRNLLFLLSHLGNFLQEDLFQGEGHQHDVVCGLRHRRKPDEGSGVQGFDGFQTGPHLVIDVAVGEHGVEVMHAFTGAPVVVVL